MVWILGIGGILFVAGLLIYSFCRTAAPLTPAEQRSNDEAQMEVVKTTDRRK